MIARLLSPRNSSLALLIATSLLTSCGAPDAINSIDKRSQSSGTEDHAANGSDGLNIIGGVTAASRNYLNVVKVSANGLCTGTLIARDWVITAAHCNPNASLGATITADGVSYGVDFARVHPLFNVNAFSIGYDLVLMHLKKPVPDSVKPATLMESVPQVGSMLTIVGYGRYGDGINGQSGGSGTKRYGSVKIDYVLAPHVMWTFDSPEKYSIAQGDSGGPSFLEGTSILVGVASGISTGAGGKLGVYGTYAFEGRIDVNRQWILATMEDGGK